MIPGICESLKSVLFIHLKGVTLSTPGAEVIRSGLSLKLTLAGLHFFSGCWLYFFPIENFIIYYDVYSRIRTNEAAGLSTTISTRATASHVLAYFLTPMPECCSSIMLSLKPYTI